MSTLSQFRPCRLSLATGLCVVMLGGCSSDTSDGGGADAGSGGVQASGSGGMQGSGSGGNGQGTMNPAGGTGGDSGKGDQGQVGNGGSGGSSGQAAKPAADGEACSEGGDCVSGVCEGEGCQAGGGTCVSAVRPCTQDLRQYCGCDGQTFQGSGSCPGDRYASQGPCS